MFPMNTLNAPPYGIQIGTPGYSSPHKKITKIFRSWYSDINFRKSCLRSPLFSFYCTLFSLYVLIFFLACLSNSSCCYMVWNSLPATTVHHRLSTYMHWTTLPSSPRDTCITWSLIVGTAFKVEELIFVQLIFHANCLQLRNMYLCFA